MADVYNKVVDIIVEELGVDPEEVTPEASFIDDLGADSLDVVELVMAFEEEFDLEIPDEDAENIKTVQDAVDYIEGRIYNLSYAFITGRPCLQGLSSTKIEENNYYFYGDF